MALLILVLLIAINSIVTFMGFRAFNGNGGDPDDYLFIPYDVHRGRNLKGMIISNFSHANMVHFFLNMYVLFSISLGLMSVSNVIGFFIIFLAALLGGDLMIYFIRKDDRNYKSLGASGYVTGLLFAYVVYVPNAQFGILFLPGLFIPSPVFALLFVGISIYLMRSGSSRISHEGHLGGALGGFAAAALIAPYGLQPLMAWFLQFLN